MKSNSSRKIIIFYIFIMLFWMALYAYMPILSTHSAEIGASESMVGTILSSYGFTQMLLRIPLGIYSDKIGRKKPFVVLGAGIAALSALGLGFASSPFLLLLFRSLAGAAASTWVTTTVLFSSKLEGSDAPKAMTLANVFNNGGQIIAMLLGGTLATHFGNQAAFFLACLFGAAAVGVSLLIGEKGVEKRVPLKISELLHVGLDRNLLFVSLLALLYQTIQQGASMGFIPTFAKTIGSDASELGMITSLTVAGSMAMSLVASKLLLDKLGARWCVIAGQIISMIFGILIPLTAKNVTALLIMQFCVGLGSGLNYPVLMGLAIKNISPAKHGAAMGFFQSIYALGMFVGPLITGFIVELVSLKAGLVAINSVGAIAVILSLIYLEKIKAKGTAIC